MPGITNFETRPERPDFAGAECMVSPEPARDIPESDLIKREIGSAVLERVRHRMDRRHAKPLHIIQVNQDFTIKRYMLEIGQYDLLSPDQEAELAIKIKMGESARELLAMFEPIDEASELSDTDKQQLLDEIQDGEQAFVDFVNANLRLVVAMAKKKVTPTRQILDLIQDGNLGLMHAVRKFDHERGFKFSTYATWWIRQSMDREGDENSRNIRLPVATHEQLKKVQRLQAYFESMNQGKSPTVQQLSELCDLPEKKITEILCIMDTISLDRPAGEDSVATFSDIIPDNQPTIEQVIIDDDMRATLRKVLADLDPREAKILDMRFGLTLGEPMVLEEIGKSIGITRERVRQIEAIALRRLRQNAIRVALEDYLQE